MVLVIHIRCLPDLLARASVSHQTSLTVHQHQAYNRRFCAILVLVLTGPVQRLELEHDI